MKKRLFSLLMALVMTASIVVFADDTEMPEVEENPNIGVPDRPLVSAAETVEESPPYDPGITITAEEAEARILKKYQAAVVNTRYNLALFSGESFETTGKIPETSEPVLLYETEFPVKIIDQNGEPVHNAMIVRAESGMTSENSIDVTFRERPHLDTLSAGYIVTNTKGEATVPYMGRFTETSLFVFAPDVIAKASGKSYNVLNYPEHTCFNIKIPTEKNPEALILQINIPEKAENETRIPSVKVKIWHNSERGAGYLCKLTKDVYTEFYAQFGPDDPVPSIGIIPPLPAAVTADETGLAILPQVEPGLYILTIHKPGEEKGIKSINITVTEGKTSTRILLLRDEQ